MSKLAMNEAVGSSKKKSKKSKTFFCPECGAKVPNDFDNCPKCDANVKYQGSCLECGEEIRGDEPNYCPECGFEP